MTNGEERRSKEAEELAAARKEYEFQRDRYYGRIDESGGTRLVSGITVPGQPGQPDFPSFEEWMSPEGRAKHSQLVARYEQTMSKDLDKVLIDFDPARKPGCLERQFYIFLGILGLMATVPLLLSKITLF